MSNIPKVIGEGTYGCVHNPPLLCDGSTTRDNEKVSKLMDPREASKEMKEYVLIDKIDKFAFKVSITKIKYIQMLKQRYISCLVNLNKDQIKKGIKEIKDNYPNKMIFDDVLICVKYRN